jgi:hypothetical protein
MRILVSTKKTQGQRKNDFCWVPEGEIVRFGMECGGEFGRMIARWSCRTQSAAPSTDHVDAAEPGPRRVLRPPPWRWLTARM